MESSQMMHRAVRSRIRPNFSYHLVKFVFCFLLIIGFLGGRSGIAFATEAATAKWSELARQFARPPAASRPWVYWFWKNGNITREGITADLEAMREVGIGGVILMEVSLSVPPGPVAFFSETWRELFRHAVSEADRLGLQVSINSAPGWTGSGGPWVRPEQSMQKLVASELRVSGPQDFEGPLPQPATEYGYYRDVSVLAFPTPETEYRIPDIEEKALYVRGPISSMPGVRPAFASIADYADRSIGEKIQLRDLRDLTDHMAADGRLKWSVPAGNWTILRFGHTSTGQTNRPAPSPGLECDKLNREALNHHFEQFTKQLLADVANGTDRALVATHLDSWEVGAQNWTRGFPEAFRQLRGYDLQPYLPVFTGRVIGSLEQSERFLWDLRQTVSELIVENHGRHLAELAQQHGLWLSIEPYDMTPCDDMTLGATADVPMCEFWSAGFDTRYSVTEATSIGHIYGKPIIAAEAFTSIDRWLFHPASVKSLGDWAFSEGVNRFVIHRFVHQPYSSIRPGLSLGPHGLHYERTQTWWKMTAPWHEYLSRCQFLLQQGQWVADLLYLSPEGAPNVFQAPDSAPNGYKYDACTPEALIDRVATDRGQLVLPDGRRYAALVLPDAHTMTPGLLEKIVQLVRSGATVIGRSPDKSPSLSGYPECDVRIDDLATILWGEKRDVPNDVTGRQVGGGRVIWGGALSHLRDQEPVPELSSEANWIWHAEDAPVSSAAVGSVYFRRTFPIDDIRQIDVGRVVMTADNSFVLYVNQQEAGSGDDFRQLASIDVTPQLKNGENEILVIARNAGEAPNPAGLVGSLLLRSSDGRESTVVTDQQWQSLQPRRELPIGQLPAEGWAAVHLIGAVGITPWGRPQPPVAHVEIYPPSPALATLMQQTGLPPDFVADTALRFAHRKLGEADIYWVSNGQSQAVDANCTFRVSNARPELWHPETGEIRVLHQYHGTADGRTVVQLRMDPAESFFVVFRAQSPEETRELRPVATVRNFTPRSRWRTIDGSWQVEFDAEEGGPEREIVLEELTDWTNREETSIRYYSGAAVYRKDVGIPLEQLDPRKRIWLDLGRVEVIARVTLNEKPLGILWKPPFCVEITEAVTAGINQLKVEVVNLWPNRMIGDENLPADSERAANGVLREWPRWVLEGQRSPTGRYSFSTWRHWQADSPLCPSGLLGPVTLQVEDEQQPATHGSELEEIDRPPNIVFIYVDDMGYADPSCFGNPIVRTPYMDRLAAEGIRLTNYYSNSPICSPSRVAVTTGQYPGRWRIHSYLEKRQANRDRNMADYLDPAAPTVARALKKAGYATAHFGKWHMGGGRDVNDAPEPSAYGFDEHLVNFEGMGPRVDGPKHQWTATYVDRAIDFMQRHQNKPFFLQLFPNDVHDRHEPAPGTQDRWASVTNDETWQRFFAVLVEMDRQIGRLVQEVDQLGLAEHTLIVLTSDNGPTDWPSYYQDQQIVHPPGFTGGLFGRKWSLYEGGVRMPFIARWKGHIPAGVTNDQSVVAGIDLPLIFRQVAGIPQSHAERLDGENMTAALMGKPIARDRPLFWQYGSPFARLKPGNPRYISPPLAMRDGPWKLLTNADGSELRLYNVVADPGETEDLADQDPERAAGMRKDLMEWYAKLGYVDQSKPVSAQ